MNGLPAGSRLAYYSNMTSKTCVESKKEEDTASPPIENEHFTTLEVSVLCEKTSHLVISTLDERTYLDKHIEFKKKESYSQQTSPTIKPFLKDGEQIISQVAVDKLKKKSTPSSDDIRVPSEACPGLLSDGITRGLHEIVPTNLRGTIAGIKNDQLRQDIAEIQSGARTSPALTLFNQYEPKHKLDPNTQFAAHTGTFIPPTSHTKGQAAAHNKSRQALGTGIANNQTGTELLIHLLNECLDSIPNGVEILKDPGITNECSSLVKVGPITKPLSPVVSTVGAGRETSRATFGIEIHERREEVKARGRALKRELHPDPGKSPDGKTRSPSPPRTPIKLHSSTEFSGGEAETGYERPLPTVPNFPTDYELAHRSGWATEPLRLDPTSASGNVLPTVIPISTTKPNRGV